MNMNWIDVKDELPKKMVKVLVTANDIAGQWVEMLYHDGSHWRFCEAGIVYPAIVTHWMATPKPQGEL